MGVVRTGAWLVGVLAVVAGVLLWCRAEPVKAEPAVGEGARSGVAAAEAIEPDPPGFEVINTQDPDDLPTPAEQSHAAMTALEGFEVTQFAAEPHVRQPIAFTIDDRGRLWVVENYSYPEWRDEPTDRVLIFEDTDGDGQFDRRRIFWDEGRNLSGIALGFGGVWLCSTPELIFIPIDEENDRPAGEPVVMLDGFDDETVGHNVVNGMRWGPDGWLYGRHGIQATSHVGAPGTPADERVALNCAIWRYHPTRETFEVVTNGTTNPWGFDYDDHGQMFFTNNVNGHLFHAIPGAHYIRMYGADFNPHLYDLLGVSTDHQHFVGDWTDSRANFDDDVAEEQDVLGGGHSHSGGMIYLGDNWPESYRNRMFMFNTHGRRINQDVLERRGAGYVATHEEDVLHANDPWFRGISLDYGPDGGVYFTDWNQFGECHDHDGIYRASGRIYKVSWGEAEAVGDLDVSKLSDAELVELQLHRNDWYVRHARRVLQERAAEGRDLGEARAKLRQMFDEQADVTRKLRAMWALHVTGGAGDDWLLDQLDHEQEHVRVWAVRLLVDHRDAPSRAAERFAQMATEDASSLVQLYLASAMQWMPVEQRGEIGEALAQRSELAGDATFPLMLWYAMEPVVAAEPQRAAAQLGRIELPTVRRFAARRLAAGGHVGEVLAQLTANQEAAFQRDVIEGVYAGLRGRRSVEEPATWSQAYAALSRHEDQRVRQRAEALAVIFGDGQAVDTLRQIAEDGGAALQQRQQAIDSLVEQGVDELAPMLHRLIGDVGVRRDAIRALAAAEPHEATPPVILDQYPRLSLVERRDAIDTLTSRPRYVGPLLEAIADDRVPRADLSPFHARQILTFEDDRLTEQLAEVWGSVRQTGEARRRQIADYQEKLTPDVLAAADVEAGRELFAQRCGQCHQLFGEGGTFGPDLTGSGRSNLDYLLLKIVDPSATVPQDQRMTIVTLHDGRVLSGIITARTEATLTLRTPADTFTLDHDRVDDVQTLDTSLMPEGMLADLTDEQLRDLFGYVTGAAEQAAQP